MTVRQRLICLVAASIGPLFLLAGLLLWQSYDRERLSIEHRLSEGARGLAQAVDLELGRARALLSGLATSDYLESGDLAAFHAQSSDATADIDSWVLLFDPEGRRVMNTRVPFGTSLPTNPVPVARSLAEAGRAGVSNLTFGEFVRAPVYGVGVPVRRGDQVLYVLGLVTEARHMARLLMLQRLPADWTLTVLDGSGIIVARSQGHEVFVGRPLAEALRAGIAAGDVVIRTEDRDGVPVMAAFEPSSESGWSVAISAPLDPYMLGVWRSISIGATAIGVVVLLVAALVFLMARSISGPIEQLGFGARALGRGQTIGPVPTTLREVGEVSRAMVAASEQIHAQMTQRDRLLHDLAAERSRLAAVLDNLPLAAVIAEAPTGRVVMANRHVARVMGHEFDAPASVAEYGRNKGYHPDGRLYEPAEWPLARAVLHGETIRNEEIAYERRDGERLVLSMSAAPIRDDGRIVAGVVVVDDITERRAGEQRQSMLAAEVDHRAKNLLAIVQVLLRQTRAESAAEYAAAAQGRVASLARAHALLSASRWHGADLRRLVEDEVTPFRGRNPDRVRIGGTPVEVTAEAAQSLAMALHELATNAAKHGALTEPAGRVEIAWRFDPQSGLDLTWTERGGPAARPPTQRGLGTAVLEQTIRHQLHGEIVCEWLRQGLRCTFRIPAAQLQLPKQAHA